MIQCPRGTRDFLPDEMERRRFFENRLRHTARTFGFREVETPIFEDAELFILRSGPNVLKELYAFEDKGGRQIALRPEMTAPVVRMFVNGMSNEPKPIKVFYFGQCFRYERPQSGRYREFFQFGAEIIGGATPETDAEAIALASAMIKQIGIKDYRNSLLIGASASCEHRIDDIVVQCPDIDHKRIAYIEDISNLLLGISHGRGTTYCENRIGHIIDRNIGRNAVHYRALRPEIRY